MVRTVRKWDWVRSSKTRYQIFADVIFPPETAGEFILI